jgi:hypothetical protein
LGEWACRQWAGTLAADAKAARAQAARTFPRDPYDNAAFIASNRHAQAVTIADELAAIANGPADHGLPWPARERLRLALQAALDTLTGQEVSCVASPAAAAAAAAAATQPRRAVHRRGG